MIKNLLILSSTVLSGIIANTSNFEVNALPEMEEVTSATSSESVETTTSEEVSIGETKTVNLYAGEILTIDTSVGSTVEKEIPDTEDVATLKIGKSVTYENEGLYFSSTPSESEVVGFEIPKAYLITSISLTVLCGGSNRSIYLSEGCTKSDSMVSNTSQLTLTKNDTVTGELLLADSYLAGGTTYYFIQSGGAVTLTNITIKVATNEAEIDQAPVIVGEDVIDSRASNPLSKEDILAMYTATDSIDGTVDLFVKYDSGYFNAIDEKIFGEYQLTLTASDSTGNSTDKVITINYYDDSAEFLPVITGPSVIYKANNILLTLDDIKELYTAKDVNGSTLDVSITNINYLKSANKVGNYRIRITAVDSEERTSELGVSIRVVKGIKDMWYIDPLDIHTTQFSKLTIDQLIDEYARFNGFEVYNYEVQEDNYTGFEDIPDTYNVKVLISTAEGLSTINIKVHVDENATLVEANEKTWIDHICSFFKSIWEWICNLFN